MAAKDDKKRDDVDLMSDMTDEQLDDLHRSFAKDEEYPDTA